MSKVDSAFLLDAGATPRYCFKVGAYVEVLFDILLAVRRQNGVGNKFTHKALNGDGGALAAVLLAQRLSCMGDAGEEDMRWAAEERGRSPRRLYIAGRNASHLAMTEDFNGRVLGNRVLLLLALRLCEGQGVGGRGVA